MSGHADQVLAFDSYRIDPVNRALSRVSGDQIELTPKVFDTLLYLVTNHGRVVSKDELMRAVWTDTVVEENNLSQNISTLRRVFGEKPGERRFIETVAGRGFRFLPGVVRGEDGSRQAAQPIASPVESAGEQGPVRSARVHRESNRWLLLAAVGLVAFAGLAGVSLWRQNKTEATPGIRSIAILPFKPLVPENRNPALELGMTDTLIWKISGGEVDVKPFSSVRRFDSLDQDPAIAGRELSVDAVLDGSLNVVNDRIRISAQLIRVSDGKQLWAGRFDDSFDDIFSVQDSISARVASELRVRLGSNDKKRYTKNAEAYQLFLKGRYLSQKAQPAELATSITYFEQALALDPAFAPSYVGLADAYRATVLIADAAPGPALSKAKAAADRAVALDDAYAEAHAMQGWLTFWYDWNWATAENEAQRALSLDPESSDARQFHAHLLSNTGRHNEALAEAKKAIDIEPLSLRANSFYGMFLYHAGRYDEAIVQFQRVLDLDPNYRLALMFMSRTLVEQGKFDEAIAAARKAQENSKEAADPLTYEAYALGKSGRRTAASAILKRFLSESDHRYVSPYNTALIYSAIGDDENALKYLEKAYAEKDIRMVFLGVEPKWGALRSEPRFIELLKKMNL